MHSPSRHVTHLLSSADITIHIGGFVNLGTATSLNRSQSVYARTMDIWILGETTYLSLVDLVRSHVLVAAPGGTDVVLRIFLHDGRSEGTLQQLGIDDGCLGLSNLPSVLGWQSDKTVIRSPSKTDLAESQSGLLGIYVGYGLAKLPDRGRHNTPIACPEPAKGIDRKGASYLPCKRHLHSSTTTISSVHKFVALARDRKSMCATQRPFDESAGYSGRICLQRVIVSLGPVSDKKNWKVGATSRIVSSTHSLEQGEETDLGGEGHGRFSRSATIIRSLREANVSGGARIECTLFLISNAHPTGNQKQSSPSSHAEATNPPLLCHDILDPLFATSRLRPR